MDWEAFFTVHRGLPREGPGTAQDVAWACGLAGLPEGAVICDAGCGPGGDIAALLDAVPGAQVVAVDKSAGFVAEAAARFAGEARVSVVEGDLGALPGPFDMIWCAGALYFLGLRDGLAAMARALKPGGVLAFSEPCFFTDAPGAEARAFWEGHPAQSAEGIAAAVTAAGFDVLGTRKVPDAGWEAYYQPMEARIAALRPDADARLAEMLDLCAAEAVAWRQIRDETGYLLCVARLS